MILDLFDKNFVRIGNIARYSYCSYEKTASEYGSFSITCVLTEKLLMLMPDIRYILLEKGEMGVLLSKSCNDVEVMSEISLGGYMLKYILSYRTLFPQFSKTGKPMTLMNEMVKRYFIDSGARKVDKVRIEEIAEEETEESTTLQVTGSDVFTELAKIYQSSGVSFDVHPTMSIYKGGISETNVSELTFKMRKTKDRSIGNKEGNSPVVFSYSFDNIQTSDYSEDESAYKNLFIVAGEGEGRERAVEYVSDKSRVLQADEHTLMLLHMDSLTDEARPTGFTMTKGSTAEFTNENTKFNGKNAHLKTQATTSFFQYTVPTLPAGDVTFEWWEYREQEETQTSNIPCVLTTTNATSNIYGAIICRDIPSQEYLAMQAGTGSSSTNMIPANTPCGNKIYNKWVHRAIVFEWILNEETSKVHLQVRSYENGKLFGTYDGAERTAPVAIYKAKNGFIGKYSSGKGMVGYLEEIRISNIARYHGETYEIPSTKFSVSGGTYYEQENGLERKELFVDARDLQSSNDNGTTMTAEEYKQSLIQRGLEKMPDYIIIHDVNATANLKRGKRYYYGVDYFEGDIVTLQIEPLNLRVNIPVDKVTITQQGNEYYQDIIFGKAKDFIKQKLRKEGVI